MNGFDNLVKDILKHDKPLGHMCEHYTDTKTIKNLKAHVVGNIKIKGGK